MAEPQLVRSGKDRRYNIIKLKPEDDEALAKLARYYNVNKTDIVRILIHEKARQLGLVTG